MMQAGIGVILGCTAVPPLTAQQLVVPATATDLAGLTPEDVADVMRRYAERDGSFRGTVSFSGFFVDGWTALNGTLRRQGDQLELNLGPLAGASTPLMIGINTTLWRAQTIPVLELSTYFVPPGRATNGQRTQQSPQNSAIILFARPPRTPTGTAEVWAPVAGQITMQQGPGPREWFLRLDVILRPRSLATMKVLSTAPASASLRVTGDILVTLPLRYGGW